MQDTHFDNILQRNVYFYFGRMTPPIFLSFPWSAVFIFTFRKTDFGEI